MWQYKKDTKPEHIDQNISFVKTDLPDKTVT